MVTSQPEHDFQTTVPYDMSTLYVRNRLYCTLTDPTHDYKQQVQD